MQEAEVPWRVPCPLIMRLSISGPLWPISLLRLIQENGKQISC